jgi:PAS domain S-box-containing protein
MPPVFADAEANRSRPASGRALAAALLLLTGIWLGHRNLSYIEERDRVGQQARDEAEAADGLLSTLKDAETGQRGFLLTGAPDFLEPYRAARARLADDLTRVEQAVRYDAAQQAVLPSLRSLVEAKMAFTADLVSLRMNGRTDLAAAIVQSRRGKQIMDRLRAEIAAIHQRGDARRAAAQARIGSEAQWLLPFATTAIAALLLGGVVEQRLRRLWSASVRLAECERFTHAFGLTAGMLRDLDGRITFWGSGMAALYGYTSDMAVGQISHTLLAAKFPAPLADIEAAFAACGDWHGELVHRCQDGSLKYVLSHWVLHHDDATGKLSVVEMNYDVSPNRHAETHLQLALDAACMGTWIWEFGDTETVTWDARTRELFGLPRDCAASYTTWQSIVVPEDLPRAMTSIDRLRDHHHPLTRDIVEYRVRHADGTIRWISACRIAHYSADAGAPAGRSLLRLIGTVRDITDARTEAAARARDAALLQTIIETLPGPIYAIDRDGKYLLANAACLALIGKPWCEVAGRTIADVLEDSVQAASMTENNLRIMQSACTEVLEEQVGGNNGHTRTWLSTKTPLQAEGGTVIGLVGVALEITERKRNEARQTLMINELNHRVKNTLATVQAIAAETLRDAPSHFGATLESRLLALAAVHDVLSRESRESADLHEVVDAALYPFADTGMKRFQVRGPPLLLLPRAAVALGMGLHELATNASKYGALQVPAGRVHVGWSVSAYGPRQLRLEWKESGGPAVTKPQRRGFGSCMIEGALAHDLGGGAAIHFEPDGVRCVLEAPLEEVAARTGNPGLLHLGVT